MFSYLNITQTKQSTHAMSVDAALRITSITSDETRPHICGEEENCGTGLPPRHVPSTAAAG